MTDGFLPVTTIPRTPLCVLPTPVQELQRLRKVLGGDSQIPRLLIKRDDLTGPALGGNKLRKLEFLLAEAQAQGADILLTAGAAQSNHCRQTAAVGAMFGLETHLCLRGPEPEHWTGNLVLNDWLGAKLHFAEPGTAVSALMADLTAQFQTEGRRPYPIPIGGSNATGAMGYVTAVQELTTQKVEPDTIVVATGSGGTQAGLEVGVRLAGVKTRVLGIGVADPDGVSWGDDIALIGNAVLERLGLRGQLTPEGISCPMDWMGPRYGVPTEAGQAALRLLAQTEGIFLDPVYSAKAFSGLLEMCRNGMFSPTETVLFWHTGGTPALFA